MMPGSYRIARVAGIDVYIHVTFFLLLAYIGFIGWKMHGEAGVVFSVLAVILLFTCVLLHEFGHAFAARNYGIATPDITLLPIGGVARIERMPDKPDQEIVIALAGPLVNVVIAFVLGAALIVTGNFNLGLLNAAVGWQIQSFPDIPTALINLLFINNVMLVVFNMIPAFPMDGGRVLRALLAKNLPIEKATEIAAGIGKTLAICFGVIGLFSNPMFILLAVFVFIGAQQEARFTKVRAITRGVGIRDVMITNFKALSQNAHLQEAIDALLSSYQHDFPVVDADGGLLGILTRRKLLAAISEEGSHTPVVSIMRKDVPAVTLNTNLDVVLDELEKLETPVVPVQDQFGRVIGLVVPENVSEMIAVREAMQERDSKTPKATSVDPI